MKKLSISEFIDKASLIHGNKYDYSETIYKNSKTKIKIRCILHDYCFEQQANNHLNGAGCPKCGNNIKKSTSIFIEEANNIHHYKYNYSLVNYKNGNNKVKIICNKHGLFKQRAFSHLSGQGCPKCSGHGKLNTIEFVLKAKLVHNKKYDYSLVNYKNISTKIKIKCIKHNIVFEQMPRDHLAGHGCPICPHTCSNKEQRWLDSLNISNLDRQKTINYLNKWYKVDGYDKNTNTIYEFYGDFWHGNPNIYNSRQINSVRNKSFGFLYKNTLEKEKILKKLGFNLVVMWESDFDRSLNDKCMF